MVNIDDFIKRLEYILDYYSLTASAFADKIGVQRSSMSHLLSGRNKPSLDFVMKIIDVFADIDLYWILNGKGSFLKIDNLEKVQTRVENINQQQSIFANEHHPNLTTTIEADKPKENIDVDKNAKFENKNSFVSNTARSSIDQNSIKIAKIVIFYTDGTFLDYSPQ